MVHGIDNIGICTTDLARSVAFYGQLGFKEAYRNERGVLVAAGEVHLFLFATRRANPPPVDHISFAVADVDALYARLREAGVPFEGPPEDQSWGAHGRFEASRWQ